MKKTFIFGFILCSFIALWANDISAQEYKYDLNKYYTPDIVRNSLDLNLNSSGSLDRSARKSPNSQMNSDTTINSNLSGELHAQFSSYISTRKYESLLQLNLDLSGNLRKSDFPTIYNASYPDTFSSSSSEGIHIDYGKKMYGADKKFFSFGLSSTLNPSTNYLKETITSSITEKTTNYFRTYITPFTGIGIGRIESVKDARQAIYILEDLSKRGVLTRHLSDDEIFKFSQIISQVKNKRFLDSRLHKIDEISTVDSFLVKNNLLTKSDASYFTTLYDNWENGANFERTSGQSFEIRLSPDINWNNRKIESKRSNPSSDTWEKQNSMDFGAHLAFNYNYAKQLNLNWEKTAFVSLSGATTRIQDRASSDNSQSNLTKREQNTISLYGNYKVGYYPSTRTNLSASISQNFNQQFYDFTTSNDWDNYFYSATTLRFSTVYYVSPQLSLSGEASISNNYSSIRSSSYKNSTNRVDADFSVALKYSFF